MGIMWDDSYSVGSGVIDEQHRKLLGLIEAVGTGGAPLATFLRSAREHFRTEERLFSRHGYPEGALHAQQHNVFLWNVTDLAEKLEAGGIAGAAVARYLRDWLVNHITLLDKRYADFLLAAGAFGASLRT